MLLVITTSRNKNLYFHVDEICNKCNVCVWKVKFLVVNSVGQIVLEYNAKKKVCTFSEAILVR
jgi:hypothetical protein